METWVQIISTVGFPICAFLICVYGLKYAYDRSREDNQKAMETVSKLADAINDNTVTLTKLVAEMEKKDE